ncbi:MAG TPA: hypothetical protein VFA33_05050 [Bryobacteraceae bacterium]|nr:hypothetical protein [Bryobacteraceae bacterium]
MTPQEITAIISAIGIISVAINIYVGLRLATVQARFEADAAALKASMIEEFARWKDEVLNAINGKYVSEKLIIEIRAGLGREIMALSTRFDRMDERCEIRHARCPPANCDPPLVPHGPGFTQPPTT